MRLIGKLDLAMASFVAFSVAGCLNQGTNAASKAGASAPQGTDTTGGTATTVKTFTMTSATATADTSSSANPPTFTLFFNANNVERNLRDFCQVPSSGANSDSSRSCKCRFRWTENNVATSKVFERTIETDTTQLQNFQVQCKAPSVYNNEIPDGTILKISYVPDTARGNNSGFVTNEFSFKKQATTSTGDFRDAEGRSFRNIFHYVCFDKFTKALGISHKIIAGPQNQLTGTTPMLPLANSFNLNSLAFSAQSYYYDFYVRSNEIGSINAGNTSFTCPQVNIGGVPSFYPLDSTFALALQSSSDFRVPVVTGNIVLPVATDPSSASGVTLGYAAKPNGDGSCPSFTDSAGRIRRTFRLRQYKALYPIRYGADGSVADRSQPVNTVYVLDRPVDKLGQDPLKPITRLGPKPCPFSFKTAQFGQKCSTDASLNGFSIDGTQINGDPKCPIYPPPPSQFVKSDGTLVIRPFRPFLSNFLENTQFKACAFGSNSPIDPEIVLSHDSTVFSPSNGPFNFYCAKHYPAAGSIIPPSNGDPFDKAPGACDLSASAAAIKTSKGYACSRTFDPNNATLNTPAAGCCQICTGADCRGAGGGVTAAGRNAAFNPPADAGNPAQSIRQLPRSIPNKTGGSGCFDPFED